MKKPHGILNNTESNTYMLIEPQRNIYYKKINIHIKTLLSKKVFIPHTPPFNHIKLCNLKHQREIVFLMVIFYKLKNLQKIKTNITLFKTGIYLSGGRRKVLGGGLHFALVTPKSQFFTINKRFICLSYGENIVLLRIILSIIIYMYSAHQQSLTGFMKCMEIYFWYKFMSQLNIMVSLIFLKIKIIQQLKHLLIF